MHAAAPKQVQSSENHSHRIICYTDICTQNTDISSLDSPSIQISRGLQHRWQCQTHALCPQDSACSISRGRYCHCHCSLACTDCRDTGKGDGAAPTAYLSTEPARFISLPVNGFIGQAGGALPALFATSLVATNLSQISKV